MDKEQLILLVGEFLDETGSWWDFVEFVEDRGYTTEEIGFSE